MNYRLPPAPTGYRYLCSSVSTEDKIIHLVEGAEGVVENKRPLCKRPMQYKRPMETAAEMDYKRRICRMCAKAYVAKRRDQKLRNSHKRCKAEGPNLDWPYIHT